MSRYFSKLSILILVCLVLFAFGCGPKKKVNVDDGKSDDTKVTQTDSKKEDQVKSEEEKQKEKEDQIRAEKLEQQRKLEEQRREEARVKKEAKEKFVNVKVYFGFDSSELTEGSQRTLEEKAEWLRNNPDAKITIEGHCDERGTTEYNLALGERRADSAKKYIVALGIDASRVETISYGEEKPAVMGTGEESWSQNRRDEFIVNQE